MMRKSEHVRRQQWHALDVGRRSDGQINGPLAGLATAVLDRRTESTPFPSDVDVHWQRVKAGLDHPKSLHAARTLIRAAGDQNTEVQPSNRRDADRSRERPETSDRAAGDGEFGRDLRGPSWTPARSRPGFVELATTTPLAYTAPSDGILRIAS